MSPSVQLWIPGRDAGAPVVEAIFDQSLRSLEGEFVGAVPSGLPEAWQLRLATEAALLGCLLQELGYFGRCSLDAVLVGEDLASCALHWVECNARWGGTSIPLTLVNRLVGDARRAPFVIVQQTGLRLAPRPFGWFLDRFGIEAGTGIQFIALAPLLSTARADANAVTAELLAATESEVACSNTTRS